MKPMSKQDFANWLTAMARLVQAEELLREALTLREMGSEGPFKTKVREFLKAGE